MQFDTSKAVKIVLVGLLISCILDMPYGYFQLVRVVALFGFGVLVHAAYRQSQFTAAAVYTGLAIVFQPLLKIAFGREIWNMIDLAVAAGLLVSLAAGSKQKGS